MIALVTNCPFRGQFEVCCDWKQKSKYQGKSHALFSFQTLWSGKCSI